MKNKNVRPNRWFLFLPVIVLVFALIQIGETGIRNVEPGLYLISVVLVLFFILQFQVTVKRKKIGRQRHIKNDDPQQGL